MLNSRGVVVLALVALPALAGEQPASYDPAAAQTGQYLYQRYCGACHGAEAKGDGVLAKDLVVKPTDLTALAHTKGGRFPYDDVLKTIDGRETRRGHGRADMPVWGEVLQKSAHTEGADAETAVARIVHYVWSVQVK